MSEKRVAAEVVEKPKEKKKEKKDKRDKKEAKGKKKSKKNGNADVALPDDYDEDAELARVLAMSA